MTQQSLGIRGLGFGGAMTQQSLGIKGVGFGRSNHQRGLQMGLPGLSTPPSQSDGRKGFRV